MIRTATALQPFKPDFVSITYGAGGGTRETTMRYATILKEEHGFEVMPHLTCVGHSTYELMEVLEGFAEAGFRNVMALRGDPPQGENEFRVTEGGFRYASDLVALIRENFPDFGIGVGGYPEKHPEAPDFETDMTNLKTKIDAGADFITTQLFFDNQVYFRFVENCKNAGIQIPILPDGSRSCPWDRSNDSVKCVKPIFPLSSKKASKTPLRKITRISGQNGH